MWDNLENKQNLQKDVLIIALPFVETVHAVAAPAALKPCVEKAGFSCLAVDANITALKQIQNNPNAGKLLDFYYSGKIHQDIEQELYDYFNTFVDKILSWNPKYIAFSMLSSSIQNPARWLLYFLGKRNHKAKIIVGGSGASTSAGELGSFVPEMLELNLIDFHITGDGEISLIECLKGNTNYPGINGIPKTYLTDDQVANLPYPDYSDYNLSLWNKLTVTITGSRGCVRSCHFCDYIEYHKNFQWRTGQQIFNEMISQSEKFQVRRFHFADSLVNGNVKEFNILITLLADYNTKNPDKAFSWGGYYIIRNKSSTDEWLWRTLKQSGAKILSIGIESLSQRVRYELGKKFDDESVVHHFYLAQKYGIKVDALMLVGYPNETNEDVINTVKWIQEHKSLGDTISFSFSTVAITPGTQLDRNKSKYGIIIDESKRESTLSREWTTSQFNHDNNFQNREKWLMVYQKVAKENNFTCGHEWSPLQNHYYNRLAGQHPDPRKILEDILNE